jgi:opacity protein-like surface antigen
VTVASLLILASTPAHALTGFGFGAKIGQVTDYDNPEIKVANLKFDDFVFFGVFARLGHEFVDLEVGIERFDDTREIDLFGESVEAETRDWITHATVKFVFAFPVLRPFVGAGVASHSVSYKYSGPLGQFNDLTISIPADQTHFGYHLTAGVKLETRAIPVNLFVEGKFQKIQSNPDTDFTTLSAGIAFSFL